MAQPQAENSVSTATTEAAAAGSFHRRLVSWPSLLAVATLIVGASTVLLHLLGVVIHQTYLAAWNIDADQFPKSTDWLLIRGYYGVWNGSAMLLSAVMQNFLLILFSVFGLAAYTRLLFSSWNPFSGANKRLTWMRRLPAWLKSLSLLFLGSLMFASVLIPLTLAFFLLVGVPATVGQVIGEALAASSKADFLMGCERSKRACTQLLKNGEQIGTGYVLDFSTTHLAYLDTEINRGRVLPKDGLEIRSMRPPEDKPESAK